MADSFCKEEEEKRYLADYLAKGGGYYRGFAANIYKELGDEEQYLNTKLKNLQYGSDYIELAKYYAKKGYRRKEMDYIWQGLEKSTGRLDELVNYAAPIYIREKNDAQLARLYDICVKTKWNINIFAIAKQLYEYAADMKDYGKKKKMLMLILESCDSNETKRWFETCKRELTEEEWEKEYENILNKVKNKNQRLYLDICMETGKEEIVLKAIQDTGNGYGFWGIDDNQYFSKRLAVKYPDEITELYWKKVKQI